MGVSTSNTLHCLELLINEGEKYVSYWSLLEDDDWYFGFLMISSICLSLYVFSVLRTPSFPSAFTEGFV